jgi:hypothetical protein
MSTSLMINALRLGNTGHEILNILDALVSDDKSTTSDSDCQVVYNAPTADVIDF